MAEAVGSFYEAAAGIDPMTRWATPAASSVAPATKNLQAAEAAARWQVILPDRVLALSVTAPGEITALSLDGSATLIRGGKVVSQRAVGAAGITAAKKAAAVKPAVPAALSKKLLADRVPKFIVTGNGGAAVAYWGGACRSSMPTARSVGSSSSHRTSAPWPGRARRSSWDSPTVACWHWSSDSSRWVFAVCGGVILTIGLTK